MSGKPAVIRACTVADKAAILEIINEAAEAYRGVIPVDGWHDPYMSEKHLEDEIASGVAFWGYDADGHLSAVMGIQPVGDVDLIRHAYVRPIAQRLGVGATLLEHIRKLSSRPLLVGTWAAAKWAIRFYQKNGFILEPPDTTRALLKKYWSIPEHQMRTSVVLTHPSR